MKSLRGFTLIELLVVIAVLGVLATGLIVLINPLGQMAKTRDAVRVSAIKQFSSSLSRYRITGSTYPTQDNTWMTSLINSGDLKNTMQNPKVEPSPCPFGVSPGSQNGYCYLTDGNAVIYVIVESNFYKQKISWCTGIVTLMWGSANGRIGLACDGPTNGSWVAPVSL